MLASATAADTRIIREDALLYTGVGGRNDYRAFKKLYGFLLETIQRIGNYFFLPFAKFEYVSRLHHS